MIASIPEPVFIVGVGRSGTSLVQSILASHPAMSFPPETGLLRRFVIPGTIDRVLRKGGAGAVVSLLEADSGVQRLGLNIAECVDRIPGSDRTGIAIYAELQRRYASLVGASRFGDKDPRLIERLPFLKRVFPSAYVVHVIRDPRDVLASKKKAAWAQNRSAVRHIAIGAGQLRLGRRLGPVLFGHRYIELIYESLLVNPAQVVADLCARIQLEFSDQMLEYQNAAAALVSADEMSWKKETLGPLLKGNSGKWRSVLTPEEIVLTESAAGLSLSDSGYVPSQNQIRPLPKAIALRWLGGAVNAAAEALSMAVGWRCRGQH